MLKITMMLGSFDRLLGESNVAHAVDVARIIDEAGLYAIAIGEHVSLGSSLEGYPYQGGLRYGDGGRKPYLEPVALHGAFAAVTSRVKLSHCVLSGATAARGAPRQTAGDDRRTVTGPTPTRIRHRLEPG